MKKIIFLDAITFPPNFNFSKPKVSHEWQQFSSSTQQEVVSRIASANVVLSNKTPLGEKEIAAAKNLELIVLTATGFDHVNIEAAKKRGIAVTNCVNYGTSSIAEHAFMQMLMLIRSAKRYSKSVESGLWQGSKSFCIFSNKVFELKGKTLTICGMGNVGKELKRMACAFGMQVVQAERKGKAQVRSGYTPFNKAIAMADVISFHLPLNQQTKNLLDKEEFQQMKNSAVIVNVARGGVVNEQECARALKQKQIAGAAFDVLGSEPPSVENSKHPLLSLLNNEEINLLVTPHVAWLGEKSLSTITRQCAENIDAFYNSATLRRLV